MQKKPDYDLEMEDGVPLYADICLKNGNRPCCGQRRLRGPPSGGGARMRCPRGRAVLETSSAERKEGDVGARRMERSQGIRIGWVTRIRTWINGVRVLCSAVELSPNS